MDPVLHCIQPRACPRWRRSRHKSNFESSHAVIASESVSWSPISMLLEVDLLACNEYYSVPCCPITIVVAGRDSRAHVLVGLTPA